MKATRGRATTLRTRLFVAAALTVVLSIGGTFTVGLVLTRRSVERANLDDLGHQTDLIAQRERESLLPFVHLKPLKPFLARQRETYQVVDLKKPSPYLDEEERARVRRGEALQGRVNVDGHDFLYAARLVGGKGFVLLRPASLSSSDWTPFWKALLIAGLIGATLAAIAAWLSARAIARPVHRVVEASRALAEGRSPQPVPVEGSAELAGLAASFNDMAEQLARAREAERSFLLSVSHELKTPLTAIRGYAEGLAEDAVGVEEAAATIRREAGRLERLVRDLLDLARMNRSEFAVQRENVDLAETAREVVRRYDHEARSFSVSLDAAVDGAAAATADADRVLQIVSNLVENALRSTPPGGAVRVRAEPGLIAVEDTGLGLPQADLERAFERFYLYDRHGKGRRLGSGLGLAIVKELTEAMGGFVSVESTVGVGTTFTVRLPIASAAPAAQPL